MGKPQPHPLNVPGDFYVEHNCCISCGVPHVIAPEHFAWDDTHCFVSRQPVTAEETERVVEAVWAAEVSCIRYRGKDQAMLRRLAEMEVAFVCDTPPPADVSPIERDVVTFNPANARGETATAVGLASEYRDLQLARNKGTEEFRFQTRVHEFSANERSARLTYSWFEDHRHTVTFESLDRIEGRWLVRHYSAGQPGGRAISLELHHWLLNDGRFKDLHWFSTEEWETGRDGSERPQ